MRESEKGAIGQKTQSLACTSFSPWHSISTIRITIPPFPLCLTSVSTTSNPESRHERDTASDMGSKKKRARHAPAAPEYWDIFGLDFGCGKQPRANLGEIRRCLSSQGPGQPKNRSTLEIYRSNLTLILQAYAAFFDYTNLSNFWPILSEAVKSKGLHVSIELAPQIIHVYITARLAHINLYSPTKPLKSALGTQEREIVDLIDECIAKSRLVRKPKWRKILLPTLDGSSEIEWEQKFRQEVNEWAIHGRKILTTTSPSKQKADKNSGPDSSPVLNITPQYPSQVSNPASRKRLAPSEAPIPAAKRLAVPPSPGFTSQQSNDRHSSLSTGFNESQPKQLGGSFQPLEEAPSGSESRERLEVPSDLPDTSKVSIADPKGKARIVDGLDYEPVQTTKGHNKTVQRPQPPIHGASQLEHLASKDVQELLRTVVREEMKKLEEAMTAREAQKDVRNLLTTVVRGEMKNLEEMLETKREKQYLRCLLMTVARNEMKLRGIRDGQDRLIRQLAARKHDRGTNEEGDKAVREPQSSPRDEHPLSKDVTELLELVSGNIQDLKAVLVDKVDEKDQEQNGQDRKQLERVWWSLDQALDETTKVLLRQ
ncbi:hypothetical protein F4780DRAFT_276544 [Xylariomycetidae sp. FL0641]|nr:hypothetical protein F4780DRAFT_276544 [Xylariomycetidae sp. FL0641]